MKLSSYTSIIIVVKTIGINPFIHHIQCSIHIKNVKKSKKKTNILHLASKVSAHHYLLVNIQAI